MFYDVKIYNEQNYLYTYYSTDFCGIEIPDNITIKVYENIKSQETNFLKYFFYDDTKTIAGYKRKDNIIYLTDDSCSEDSKHWLKHELLHYNYRYNLTEEEKIDIHNRKKLFCQNDDEFYAYTTADYGKFELRWK